MELDYTLVREFLNEQHRKGVNNFRQFFADNPELLIHCLNLVKNYGINKSAINIWGGSCENETLSFIANTHIKQLENGAFKESFIGLAEGNTNFGFEETIQTALGKQKTIHVQISIAPGYEATLSKAYVCFSDTSQLTIAEEKLRAYQEHLEEMVRERTQQLSEEIERRKQAEQTLEVLYLQEKNLQSNWRYRTNKE
jgi:hypothetical protein